MSRTIEAIYEDGVLKPLEPLGLPEHARTRVTLEEEEDTRKYAGTLPRKFRSAGIGRSGRGNFSEQAEELLAGNFGRK